VPAVTPPVISACCRVQMQMQMQGVGDGDGDALMHCIETQLLLHNSLLAVLPEYASAAADAAGQPRGVVVSYYDASVAGYAAYSFALTAAWVSAAAAAAALPPSTVPHALTNSPAPLCSPPSPLSPLPSPLSPLPSFPLSLFPCSLFSILYSLRHATWQAQRSGLQLLLHSPRPGALFGSHEPADPRWNRVKVLLDAMTAEAETQTQTDTHTDTETYYVWLDADLTVLDDSFSPLQLLRRHPEAHVLVGAERHAETGMRRAY